MVAVFLSSTLITGLLILIVCNGLYVLPGGGLAHKRMHYYYCYHYWLYQRQVRLQ